MSNTTFPRPAVSLLGPPHPKALHPETVKDNCLSLSHTTPPPPTHTPCAHPPTYFSLASVTLCRAAGDPQLLRSWAAELACCDAFRHVARSHPALLGCLVAGLLEMATTDGEGGEGWEVAVWLLRRYVWVGGCGWVGGGRGEG